jgi:dynein heavy chain
VNHQEDVPDSVVDNFVFVVVACSTQYKTVLDALRSRKDRFLFEDVEIGLRTSVMAFM